jgi:putative membrane protein
MNTSLNWALVAHIVGIVFWLGGLLVAARVLAGLGAEGSPEARKTLAALERKLLRGIVHPGAAITVLAGIAIVIIRPEYLRETWLHVKLTLVVILIAVDLLLTARFRAYEGGRAEIRPAEAKLAHGAVALLLLAIVTLAVLKPFS